MFQIGDKIFAKLPYYPHWPGIIDDIISNDKTGKPIKYFVKCYGDNNYITVKPSDICSYEENKSIYGQQKADNYRNKKINAALLEAEEAHSCQVDAGIKVNEISKVIDSYNEIEDIDLETSLTLAAEAGNALLSENSKLKLELEGLQSVNLKLQTELYNTQHDIQTHLQIEEDLKEKCQILTEKSNELLQELNHSNKRAEEERILKEEFIQQTEVENKSLISEIDKLKHKLIDQNNLTKQIEFDARAKINLLLKDVKKLQEEVSERDNTIQDMQNASEDLIFKITNVEKATRLHLSSFLTNIKGYSNATTAQKPHNQQNLCLTRTPDDIDCSTASLQEELCQSLGDREIFNKESKKPLTTSLAKPRDFSTAQGGQTCNKKLNCYRNTCYSTSLQVAKAAKKCTTPLQMPQINGNGKPPLNAKIKAKEETYEEFFLKHIDFYRECMTNTLNYMTKTCNTPKAPTSMPHTQQINTPQPKDREQSKSQAEHHTRFPSTTINFLEINQSQNNPD